MKTRLYCKHCKKYYDVPLQDVRLLQEEHSGHLTFQNNTYYYEGDCFFKMLHQVKHDGPLEGAVQ